MHHDLLRLACALGSPLIVWRSCSCTTPEAAPTASLPLTQQQQGSEASLGDVQGPARDGEASGGPEERARSTLERLRVLQSHLCSYVQRSVPVVKVELANFNETLDRLHDYLLLCIQMAMEQDEADAHQNGLRSS